MTEFTEYEQVTEILRAYKVGAADAVFSYSELLAILRPDPQPEQAAVPTVLPVMSGNDFAFLSDVMGALGRWKNRRGND